MGELCEFATHKIEVATTEKAHANSDEKTFTRLWPSPWYCMYHSTKFSNPMEVGDNFGGVYEADNNPKGIA